MNALPPDAAGLTPRQLSPRSRVSTYFEAALEQFDRMAASPGATVTRNLIVAGRPIRVQITSGVMERAILRGLAHLETKGDVEPDLTIAAWDSDTTGARSLAPGWTVDDYGRDGFVAGFNDDRFHTALQFEPILFRMIDMERRRAIYWTPSAPQIPYWEVGAPLRPLLHEWLRRKGFLAVHAGAVGRTEGGVLLAGAGGRGKSNTALACLASDLLYASDDFCCVSQSPDWTVHSLYSTGKIAGADIARHPHLKGAASNPGSFSKEKALFFLAETFPQKLIREMPLRAIIMPKVVGHGGSEIVPTSTATAQRAIAMSTIELSRWMSAYTFAKVAELVRALPCYELRIGVSISDAPTRICELLNNLG